MKTVCYICEKETEIDTIERHLKSHTETEIKLAYARILKERGHNAGLANGDSDSDGSSDVPVRDAKGRHKGALPKVNAKDIAKL